MEIAKYIALFLLKNNFCYIPGLGNLELKKKPASYDGENLQAPHPQVELTPTGSIDDTLANFIATNEQTSISKAANELREFSIQSRTRLDAGEDVVIPSIGKFISRNGKISFITDLKLEKPAPPVPAQQIVRRQEEEPLRNISKSIKDDVRSSGTNPTKIALFVLGVAVLAAIIIFVLYKVPGNDVPPMNVHAADTAKPLPPASDAAASGRLQVDTLSTSPVMDTAAAAVAPSAAPDTNLVAIGGGMYRYRIMLQSYESQPAADKRLRKLKVFGDDVQLVTRNSRYYIVMPVQSRLSDTTRIADSLRQLFNPAGVHIFR